MSLLYLSINSVVTSFVVVVILIVYSGAVMVLIGYVSAVSPNFISHPSFSFTVILRFLVILVGARSQVLRLVAPLPHSTEVSFVDFFYSSAGCVVFLILLFSLFATLLIVTSQYLCPNGPFRSSS
jgi:hypothetical protein